MADPTLPPNTVGPELPSEHHANIRTMQSDVSEFLRDTKPSLIKLLTNQLEEGSAEKRKVSTPRNYSGIMGALIITVVAIGVMAVGGYFIYKAFHTVTPQQVSIVIPQPLFSIDGSETISRSLPSDGDLVPLLSDEQKKSSSVGHIQRLVFLTELSDKSVRSITPSEFFTGETMKASSLLITTIQGPVMPLFVGTDNGSRLVLVMKTNDPARVKSEFLARESSLLFDFKNLFVGTDPVLKILPFEDKIYRNISYRRAQIDSADLQFIYGIFPAREILIISPSDQAFRSVIDRLYQGS